MWSLQTREHTPTLTPFEPLCRRRRWSRKTVQKRSRRRSNARAVVSLLLLHRHRSRTVHVMCAYYIAIQGRRAHRQRLMEINPVFIGSKSLLFFSSFSITKTQMKTWCRASHTRQHWDSRTWPHRRQQIAFQQCCSAAFPLALSYLVSVSLRMRHVLDV